MINIAIFASGTGSNAAKIIEYFRDHSTISISLIVCNRPGAGVVTIAANNRIPVLLIEKERFFRGDAYFSELKNFQTDFIVLAGFLWKIPAIILKAFHNRIVNIHPALLPKYGGKGMYGSHVHQAVIENHEPESGITIHYVDEHYDNGDIIFQISCPVVENDSPKTLAERIAKLEHKYYPEVIERLLLESESPEVRKSERNT